MHHHYQDFSFLEPILFVKIVLNKLTIRYTKPFKVRQKQYLLKSANHYLCIYLSNTYKGASKTPLHRLS
jgi:hypothetical protein